MITLSPRISSPFSRFLKIKKHKDDSYFYRSFFNVKNIDYYLSLFNELENRENVVTEKEICLSSKFSFGSSIREVKYGLKEDFYKVKSLCGTVVLYAKTFVGSDKVILELHFYKKKLVLFRYTFSNINNKNKIESTLVEKYLNPDTKVCLDNCLIKDYANNSIVIDDKVNFSVLYFSFNFGFYDHIMKINKTNKDKSINRRIKWNEEIMKRL